MILQSYDNQTGAFNSTDRYACRIVVPWAHKLTSAKLICLNCVLTGTVEVFLRFADHGSSRGGAQVGLKLENDDMDDLGVIANTFNKWPFDIQTYNTLTAPADRIYFIQGTATDAADRINELVLMIDVERV